LDSKAIARYSRIEDYAHDVYECLKIHAALERAYEARQKFRRVAIHPSAYDKGHDIRINMIWEWIERCTFVLESIHTEMTEINAFANINVTFGEIDTDVQAQIWKGVANASKKPRETKKRVSRAMRRVREIEKEERVWSEFIPLAQKERQAAKDRLRKALMDMLTWFESAGEPITMKELKWVLMFRWFMMMNLPYSYVACAIRRTASYMVVSELLKFDVEDVYCERKHLSCHGCLMTVHTRFAEERKILLMIIAQGALKIRSLLENQKTNVFSLRVARVGCDLAKLIFYVGSETVNFYYYGIGDSARFRTAPFKPRGEAGYERPFYCEEDCKTCKKHGEVARDELSKNPTEMVIRNICE
jgi:hypothetical protein